MQILKKKKQNKTKKQKNKKKEKKTSMLHMHDLKCFEKIFTKSS